MAHISKLSRDILHSTLLSVIEPFIRGNIDLNSWKPMLLLLGVCHQWSEILSPFVNQYVIVWCTRTTRTSITSKPQQPLDGTENYIWKTNISIIKERGFTRRVRRMNIAIRHSIDDNILLCSMLTSILDLGNTDWSNVVILYMSFMYSRPDNAIKLKPEEKNMIASIAKLIQQNIPNVNTLNFGSTLENNPAKFFVEALTSTYAGQLMDFRSLSPIYITMLQFSFSLAKLNIALDDNNTKLLPLVCSKSLRHLELHSVPQRFTWQYFSVSYGDKEIHFNKLESISLHYKDSDTNSLTINQNTLQLDCYYKICMPRLKSIVLNNAPPFGDILFANFDSPDLEYVSVNGRLQMALNFGNLEFYASKRMRIDIKKVNKSDEKDLYISTNKLFGQSRRALYTELLFDHNGFDIDFERVKWNNLDKLDFFGDIDFDHLLELIIKLPLLESLNITSLVFSNYEIGMYNQIMQQAPSRRTDMLYTNICNLSISSDMEIYSMDLVLSKVMYFVLRMGSLKVLELDSEIEHRARKLIDRYKVYLPHLANIVVREGLVFL